MSHWTYLVVLGACLAAVLPLDRIFGLGVLSHPLRLARALAPGFVIFVGWDVYAVHAGQWTYDPRQILGLTLPGRLPVEEVLFFVVVPLSSVLSFEAVKQVRARRVDVAWESA